MTCKEIYDNLAADIEKINIKKNYLWSRAISKFKKERIFPAWTWYEYTIPATRNTYIIFFMLKVEILLKNPNGIIFVFIMKIKRGL